MESRGRGVLDTPHARGMTGESLPRATPSIVIVREGGRPSIPEASVMESRGHSVLDTPHWRGMTENV
jgi:hypothetical protein